MPYDPDYEWECPDCGRINSNEISACLNCATVNPDWDPDEEKDS